MLQQKVPINNTNNMKVCAVVVTYNASKWVDKCFGSMRNSSVPIKAFAIDNDSADDTVRLIRENFSEVEIIETGANLGFGRGNNIGIKKSIAEGADYVLLLNQDAWLEKDTIQKLINIAEQDRKFGILSPFHLDVSGTKLERQFVEFLSYNYNGMLVSDLYLNAVQKVYPTKYIHAAAWLLSKKCLEKVGGFDPLFYHYGEDDDMLQRVKYFGFQVGIVPDATITHDGVYKTWDMMEWNENRNIIIAYHQLKQISSPFRSNLLAYIKSSFDELTTLLVFRKFKKFRFRFKIFRKVIWNIKKIKRSYRDSFTEGAFLK
jgi:GT2 family glycosyltransferase